MQTLLKFDGFPKYIEIHDTNQGAVIAFTVAPVSELQGDIKNITINFKKLINKYQHKKKDFLGRIYRRVQISIRFFPKHTICTESKSRFSRQIWKQPNVVSEENTHSKFSWLSWCWCYFPTKREHKIIINVTLNNNITIKKIIS